MQIRTAVILLAGIPSLGQPQGFVYLAPGGALTRAFAGDAFVHFGGGGEFVMKNGIGVGADGGVIGVLFGGTTGTVSLNGSYHFRHQRLVDPFVTAGYSQFFARTASSLFATPVNEANLSLFNFGGGTICGSHTTSGRRSSSGITCIPGGIEQMDSVVAGGEEEHIGGRSCYHEGSNLANNKEVIVGRGPHSGW